MQEIASDAGSGCESVSADENENGDDDVVLTLVGTEEERKRQGRIAGERETNCCKKMSKGMATWMIAGTREDRKPVRR